MKHFARWVHLAAVLLCLQVGVAHALVPGRDFKPLNPAQPTPAGKVEVIEFFSYACPHCYSLVGPLSAWLKHKPADVEYRRIPAVFNETWSQFAHVYYTLDALGVAEKLHQDVFAAVHRQRLRLNDPKIFADWAASKGIDRQKLMDTYNSFAVRSLTQRASDLTKRYVVEFTPSMVVDGRYVTGPSMTSPGSEIDYNHFFRVLDQLIAAARKKPGSVK